MPFHKFTHNFIRWRCHIIDTFIGSFLKICSMTNAFVRRSIGLGYAKFLPWLWGHLGVQGFGVEGKIFFGFCESGIHYEKI
jgi:hypothetical protein